MTRALIMAGGDDEKWTRLGGEGRRHFQVVCGERVIDRIIRQLRDRGVTDIGVIAPPTIPEYDIPDTFRVNPTHTAWGHEALNGRAHWHAQQRTIQVYGDTIFSEAAMDVIVGYAPQRFQMFGRFDRGCGRRKEAIKGGGGELFAMSFWPEQRDAWSDALDYAFDLKARGIIKRAGSWEGYRVMGGARGMRVALHRLYPAVFTNICDRTDDFDAPSQYAKLVRLFSS